VRLLQRNGPHNRQLPKGSEHENKRNRRYKSKRRKRIRKNKLNERIQKVIFRHSYHHHFAPEEVRESEEVSTEI
jgi:hypothetical protein